MFFEARWVDFECDHLDIVDIGMTEVHGVDDEVEDDSNCCQSMVSFHHTYLQILSNLQQNISINNHEKYQSKEMLQI